MLCSSLCPTALEHPLSRSYCIPKLLLCMTEFVSAATLIASNFP